MHEMNCYYREKWYIEARYKNLKKGIFFFRVSLPEYQKYLFSKISLWAAEF